MMRDLRDPLTVGVIRNFAPHTKCMKFQKITTLAFVILCLVGLFVVVRISYRRPQTLIPSSSIEIKAEQLADVVRDAKAGDANAAARLGRHFLIQGNYSDAYEWMERAKALGHPHAEEALKGLRSLLRTPTPQSSSTPG